MQADRTAVEESALLVELHPMINCGAKASRRQVCGGILSWFIEVGCLEIGVVVVLPSQGSLAAFQALTGVWLEPPPNLSWTSSSSLSCSLNRTLFV